MTFSIPAVNSSYDESDSRYSIGVVTRRTGLSPDVLRAWERRYAVVAPSRTDGGQRLYSASDIEKLRLLRRLVEGGHRIASVAKLDLDALTALVREVGDAAGPTAPSVGRAQDLLEELIAAVEALDAVGLEASLRRSAMTLGSEVWIETVIGPLLEAVGDRWHDGKISPAHEHLATATAREVIAWVVRSFTPVADAPLILIATPAGELHELGAMMAAVIAAEAGWRVQYLGPNIPAEDLADAARQLRANAVALSVVHPDHAARSVDEVRQLRRSLSARVPIIVGGKTAVATAAHLARVGATIAADARAFRAELAAVTPVP